jgi:hypothetical protein
MSATPRRQLLEQRATFCTEGISEDPFDVFPPQGGVRSRSRESCCNRVVVDRAQSDHRQNQEVQSPLKIRFSGHSHVPLDLLRMTAYRRIGRSEAYVGQASRKLPEARVSDCLSGPSLCQLAAPGQSRPSG